MGRWGNWFNQELFGRPVDPAVGAEDRPAEPAARLRAVRHLPADLPLRVDLGRGGVRLRDLGRPPLQARPRPGDGALRDGLHRRARLDRDAADRRRGVPARARPAPQRLDLDRALHPGDDRTSSWSAAAAPAGRPRSTPRRARRRPGRGRGEADSASADGRWTPRPATADAEARRRPRPDRATRAERRPGRLTRRPTRPAHARKTREKSTDRDVADPIVPRFPGSVEVRRQRRACDCEPMTTRAPDPFAVSPARQVPRAVRRGRVAQRRRGDRLGRAAPQRHRGSDVPAHRASRRRHVDLRVRGRRVGAGSGSRGRVTPGSQPARHLLAAGLLVELLGDGLGVLGGSVGEPVDLGEHPSSGSSSLRRTWLLDPLRESRRRSRRRAVLDVRPRRRSEERALPGRGDATGSRSGSGAVASCHGLGGSAAPSMSSSKTRSGSSMSFRCRSPSVCTDTPSGSELPTSARVVSDRRTWPPTPDRAQPCGPHDVDPEVALAAERRLARVQTHPHADHVPVRPVLDRVQPLRLDGRRDGVAGAREREEEGVALGVDLDATPVVEARRASGSDAVSSTSPYAVARAP